MTEITAAPRRRMLRYEVGIDGPVTLGLTSDPVRTGALAYGAGVEFWAEHDEAKPPRERTFRVFGTGHVLPPGARWAGTAPRTPEGLVWHLYEETTEPGPRSSPAELWERSGGNRDLYRDLLRRHGHVLAPGDEGYDPDVPQVPPCDWVAGE